VDHHPDALKVETAAFSGSADTKKAAHSGLLFCICAVNLVPLMPYPGEKYTAEEA
jgi:hypothetical protein